MCFAVAKSQNQATAFISLLKKNGIHGDLTMAPKRYAQKGCLYGVRIRDKDRMIAEALLRALQKDIASGSSFDIKIHCE